MTGLLKKNPLKALKGESAVAEPGTYIDLGQMVFEDEASALQPAKAVVRLADIIRYEDVNAILGEIYKGNIVILDVTSVANDQLTMKRITVEIKNAVKETGGDIAGVSKNLIMITPGGIKIDRQKMKLGF
ncbi:MAG: cell division protein SepF [Thermoplasmata archaeon]|nr:cell division protein SepF [Thermoplasmata archaeon]